MHQRTAIRKAVVAVLSKAVAGKRFGPNGDEISVVESQRSPDGLLTPFTIMVRTDAEKVNSESESAEDLEAHLRELSVEVWISLRGSDGIALDELTDDVCGIVEGNIFASTLFFGGELVTRGVYYQETAKFTEQSGSFLHETAKITLTAVYNYAPEITVTLDDFLRAPTQYDLEAAQLLANQASDSINLPGPTP